MQSWSLGNGIVYYQCNASILPTVKDVEQRLFMGQGILHETYIHLTSIESSPKKKNRRITLSAKLLAVWYLVLIHAHQNTNNNF